MKCDNLAFFARYNSSSSDLFTASELETVSRSTKTSSNISLFMRHLSYTPPTLLKNGMTMTVYTALKASRNWEKTITESEPLYQEKSLSVRQECQFLALWLFPNAHEELLSVLTGLQEIWITNGF